MHIDTHVHVANLEISGAVSESRRFTPAVRFFPRRVRRQATSVLMFPEKQDNLNARWMECLAGWVRESSIDRVVLLALDAAFNEDSDELESATSLHVRNDFVQGIASSRKEFLFGASVHPYREDAVSELENVIKQGACLIKWIPSTQHIEPDHAKCRAFYEVLAHYGIPLLSHTGVEHTLGARRTAANHPAKLVPALKTGVKVIAAHCGANLFLHEPSYFKAWANLAHKYSNLYGDLGAFAVVTRVPFIRKIFNDEILRRKVLYGSDFPSIPSPGWCWQLGVGKMLQLCRIQNPLERNLQTMLALGMPREVFDRGEQVLPSFV